MTRTNSRSFIRYGRSKITCTSWSSRRIVSRHSRASCRITPTVASVSTCFFFSSRRRHTRLQGDWSSDVCSSDLKHREAPIPFKTPLTQTPGRPAPRLRTLRPHVSAAAPESPRRVNKSETVRPGPTDTAASITAEVLVPDEERAAFAKFLAGEQIVSSKSSGVVLRVPEAPRDLAPLPPVEIARLEVLPLNGEEGSRGEF